MELNINRIIEKRRIGITFRRLKDFSVSKLTPTIETLKLESEAPIIGTDKRRAIQQFSYLSERNEYHLSSMVTIPFKIKYPSIENGELKINERVEYIARYVDAIIRLKSKIIILFSQSQPEICKFSKYVKEITTKGFHPTPMRFEQETMRQILKYFRNINQLKFSKNGSGGVNSIRFKGENLLNDAYVSKILSDNDYNMGEIGGEMSLSKKNDNYIKFYINQRGRSFICGDLSAITIDNIYPLLLKIEKNICMGEN